MRTRKLTCPLPLRRLHLENKYFEKSVKRSLPQWMDQLQKWEENNSLHTEQKIESKKSTTTKHNENNIEP